MRIRRRPAGPLLTLLLALFTTSVVLAPTAGAAPPGIPSEATARSELAGLRTAAEGSMSGYSRDRFPHWSSQSSAGSGCDTRDVVLRRDGTGEGSSCPPTSGRWYSPYEGATQTQASDIDIDHVVPLAAAWRSGAAGWSESRRQQFANDLTRPQLIAVTDVVNQAKGDQTPAQWRPPSTGYWCTYAKMWVRVKSYYGLTVTSAERSALAGMLDRC